MSEKPHYHGHRKRLRERFLEDPKRVADYELLECLLGFVVLRKDTKPLAKDLLDRFGNIREVMLARPEELRKVKGFGAALECCWEVLRELRARYEETALQERVVFDSPKVVANFAMSRLGGKTSEEFWVALVDNKNRLKAWECISQGTVDQAAVYPREVLGVALELKASGMVMVHNHPGGDVRPSDMDIQMTKRICQAAQALGVRMLDHLIVVEDDFYSFQAQGLLSEFR